MFLVERTNMWSVCLFVAATEFSAILLVMG